MSPREIGDDDKFLVKLSDELYPFPDEIHLLKMIGMKQSATGNLLCLPSIVAEVVVLQF